MYSLLYLISSLSVSILKLVQDILTFSWYLSVKDDKGVWTLLQWTPVITYYLLKQMSNFVPVNSLSSGIMCLCYPTNLPKLKLRTWRYEYFCQQGGKKFPSSTIQDTYLNWSDRQVSSEQILLTKHNPVALYSHNTLPKADRVFLILQLCSISAPYPHSQSILVLRFAEHGVKRSDPHPHPARQTPCTTPILCLPLLR